MKTVIVFAALLCVAFAALSEKEYQDAFTNWMQNEKKSYHHDEFVYRYRIFKSNLDYVNNWNAQGKSSKLAANKFADLTNEEFRRTFLGVKPKAALNPVYEPSTPSAATVDWRAKGAVTDVKNQGQCGSCWSFSTTGSVEACHFFATGNLVALSEQNLMDCSTAQGNQGCDGGLMTQAMDYIESNGGLDTEASYPYTAEDGTCNYNAANSGAALGTYQNVKSGSEADLVNKVNLGPVSIAIDASQNSFQLYSSGVYSDPSCSSSQLDHGVLAVGYGHDNSANADYWIVKNSWGADWGMSGYINIARNDNNMCGVATMATLPEKCK